MSLHPPHTDVAVIGGGVVGAAIAFHLTHRGVATSLFEREPQFALAASGTNSGCLHTGFDSTPGELETDLILRSSRIRPQIMETLGIPVLRCGAVLTPRSQEEQAKVNDLAANAAANGVHVNLLDTGVLEIPGEWITDPVVYTTSLLNAAVRGGAQAHTGHELVSVDHNDSAGRFALTFRDTSTDRGTTVQMTANYVINAAGLFADDVARMIGDDSFSIYPRKGEFLVFDQPRPNTVDHIILPVPSGRTKGVLVFPTIDGKVIAGPTAIDENDKHDWSVRPEAQSEIVTKIAGMAPELTHATPVSTYCGLRTAGIDNNYVIETSSEHDHFVNVAAIRSTGLSACHGIAEYVAELLSSSGLPLGDLSLPASVAWWRRTADHRSHHQFPPTTTRTTQ